MDLYMWIAVGVALAIGAAVMSARGNKLGRALNHAHRSGEVTELAQVILSSGDKGQDTRWDHAIGSLWKGYARQPATLLVIEAAKHSGADIVQYWIGQVLQVEPELAEEHFSEELLAAHFKPEVASSCGRKGCCGG